MNHKNTENKFTEPSNQLCSLNNVVANTYDLRNENTVFLSDFTLLSPPFPRDTLLSCCGYSFSSKALDIYLIVRRHCLIEGPSGVHKIH